MRFLDDSACVIRSISNDTGAANGVVRSNYAIPNSLPAFYFEVKILDPGLELPFEDQTASADNQSLCGWKLAVGLYRSGLEMIQVPGLGNSYALSAGGGQIHEDGRRGPQLLSTVEGILSSTSVSRVTFSKGDVIGCGWNIRRKQVFFTLNGEVLEPAVAFEGVTGQFCACAWIENCNAELQFNFGQDPFLFDFSMILPANYTKQTAAASTTTEAAPLSDVELRRQTAAEDLAMIMEGFPKEICVIALESSNDKYVARHCHHHQ